MKRIAAVTMVRHDDFFLQKWIEYYGSQVGKENLYVFFDGTDQEIPGFCKGINATKVEKIGNTRAGSDKGRINFISEQTKQLFRQGYELVIGGDADEYLSVDPAKDKTLAEYLSGLNIKNCCSGLGLDFGQKLDEEPPLTLARPFLEQRRFAQIGTRYTKASVLVRPLKWGSGFHRVKGRNFHIIPDLYLMHFGYSDIDRIKGRLSDQSRLSDGWEGHVKKRSRTIRLVNSLKPFPLDMVKKFACRLETIFRPPYAWNKPALLGMKIIVELPSRFRNIL